MGGFLTTFLGHIDVETPNHEVVSKSEDYEVWRLPAQVAASVNSKDISRNDDGSLKSGNDFGNTAFRMLARYIGVIGDPENMKPGAEPNADAEKDDDEKDGEKVSMTAPVISTPREGEKVAMTAPVIVDSVKEDETDADGGPKGETLQFLLPAKYKSVEEAPKPTDPAIKLGMVEEGRCEAVLSYSGNSSSDRTKGKANELLTFLKRDNVSIIGEWTLQRYNPPFSLPWFKRNEIHVPVDPTSVKGGEDTATEQSTVEGEE